MRWSIINFSQLVETYVPRALKKSETVQYLKAIFSPSQELHEKLLYKQQHDGRTIYLEKVLNESYNILDYDPNNHNVTKKIFIEDVPPLPRLYVHQDDEEDVIFIEDDDSEDDIFLDAEDEGFLIYSFIIFIPETIVFEEYQVRALVDEFRSIGHKYIIQTYTL